MKRNFLVAMVLMSLLVLTVNANALSIVGKNSGNGGIKENPIDPIKIDVQEEGKWYI